MSFFGGQNKVAVSNNKVVLRWGSTTMDILLTYLVVVVDTLPLEEGDNHWQVGSQVLEDIHQVLGGTHQ